MTGYTQGGSTGKRILLVEDDKDTCDALAELLRRPGREVLAAYTVAEGLRLARAGGFDLIILDNWFWLSSGVELCRQIREFDPETWIIFYTAAAYDKDIEEGLRAGADAYVVKPEFKEFERVVSEMLSHKKKA